jgi:hypothetical protein
MNYESGRGSTAPFKVGCLASSYFTLLMINYHHQTNTLPSTLGRHLDTMAPHHHHQKKPKRRHRTFLGHSYIFFLYHFLITKCFLDNYLSVENDNSVDGTAGEKKRVGRCVGTMLPRHHHQKSPRDVDVSWVTVKFFVPCQFILLKKCFLDTYLAIEKDNNGTAEREGREDGRQHVDTHTSPSPPLEKAWETSTMLMSLGPVMFFFVIKVFFSMSIYFTNEMFFRYLFSY